MAYYVVAGAMLKCTHGGMAPIPSGDSRLQISGAAAVTAGMEAGVSFAAGTPPCPFATSNGPSPCTATQAATSGISAKLTIGGKGVLLDSAGGLATNAQDPSAQWTVAVAGQQLLQEG